jgi:toxin-antitoxin system PIN domain toxin
VTELLDVNVLVSLAWPNHVHHARCRRWLASRGGRPWATTPVTESGFVRVSSNRTAIPTAVSPGEALTLLERMRQQRGHRFLPDDVEIVLGSDRVDPLRIVSHRSVTDAHLLAVARRHGAVLATLDEGVRSLAADRPEDVLVIPAGLSPLSALRGPDRYSREQLDGRTPDWASLL